MNSDDKDPMSLADMSPFPTTIRFAEPSPVVCDGVPPLMAVQAKFDALQEEQRRKIMSLYDEYMQGLMDSVGVPLHLFDRTERPIE